MIRIGIAGMGGMGWFHASRYFQIPDVQVVAIADVRADRLEARHAVQINIENESSLPDLAGVQRFNGADALIAKGDVDIIDITLPSYMHAEYVVKALQAGRHVLCEKPMALSVGDADRMIEASRQAGRKLMIAQCIRFWPEYQYLKRVIQEDHLGRLLSLNLYRIGGRPSGWGWEDWFLDPARSGGSMYDLHIHDVDFVNYLLGAPDHILASSRRATLNSGCEVIHALFGYAGGPQVSISGGWSEVQIPFKAGYEAWFEKGFLRLDPDKTPSLRLYDGVDRQIERPAVYPPGDAYLNEIQYFVECVKNNQDLLECPPESARESLALLARERAAIESAEVK